MTTMLTPSTHGNTLLAPGRSVWLRAASARSTVVAEPSSDGGPVATHVGTYPSEDVIPLPMPGDALHGGEHFLGWAAPNDRQDMTALTTGGLVLSRTLKNDPSEWDARLTVDPAADCLPLGKALGLLADEHVAHRQGAAHAAEAARVAAEQRAQDRLDNLVSEAHTWANENELCGKFDEFCREHGLPQRQHEWEVTVRLTLEVPVPVTVTGGHGSDSDAFSELNDSYNEDDVLDLLRRGTISLHQVSAYEYECWAAEEM